MKGKLQNSGHEFKQIWSTRYAVLISAVMGLLVLLLGTIVANMIHVPARWDWVPVVALVVVFLASLPVTLAMARESRKAPREGDEGQESVGMKVEVARNARLKGVEWSGDVGNVIIKGGDIPSEDKHADND